MGYGFCCSKRKDEDTVFYTSCMYAYESVFKECFGREVTSFNGRVTNAKALEFRQGVDNLANDPQRYNSDSQQMMGYIDNCSYTKLVQDLYTICDMIDRKEIKYLSIM